MNPDLALSDENIDYVVIGEGEYVFSELLAYLTGNGPPSAQRDKLLKGEMKLSGAKGPIL